LNDGLWQEQELQPSIRCHHRPTETGLVADPYGGDLFVFRGRLGSLVKIIWHDGIGMSLYAKRLEKGRFVWPSAKDGVVALTASRLACLLDEIDWRNPQYSWRPASAGQPLSPCAEGRRVIHSPRGAAVSSRPNDIKALRALLAAAVQRAEAEARAAMPRPARPPLTRSSRTSSWHSTLVAFVSASLPQCCLIICR
jgi:transposase